MTKRAIYLNTRISIEQKMEDILDAGIDQYYDTLEDAQKSIEYALQRTVKLTLEDTTDATS